MDHGAYYFAGLAVECALKACIARHTRTRSFFPTPQTVRACYSHDLPKLLQTAGLEVELERDSAIEPAIGVNWSVVSGWNCGADSRYNVSVDLKPLAFYAAVTAKPHGVIAWIEQYW